MKDCLPLSRKPTMQGVQECYIVVPGYNNWNLKACWVSPYTKQKWDRVILSFLLTFFSFPADGKFGGFMIKSQVQHFWMLKSHNSSQSLLPHFPSHNLTNVSIFQINILNYGKYTGLTLIVKGAVPQRLILHLWDSRVAYPPLIHTYARQRSPAEASFDLIFSRTVRW